MRRLKYRCLVLDHDDTVVRSTETIHYPCFREYVQRFFPDYKVCTLEEYWLKNFHPGITALLRDEVGMDDVQMRHEQDYWNEYVSTRVPRAFEGIRETLIQHREMGGLICVASHSLSHNILRDYRENGLPEPDLVFGWDMEPSLRKPNPYALERIRETFSLDRRDMLVLDDLKPGCDMARAFGAPVAGCGWANDLKPIEDYMRAHCDYYFATVGELSDFLFGASERLM